MRTKQNNRPNSINLLVIGAWKFPDVEEVSINYFGFCPTAIRGLDKDAMLYYKTGDSAIEWLNKYGESQPLGH